MNIIQIAGHLGADPETRFTSSGQKVTNLRVATKVRKNGKDDTIWFRVIIWGERFDKMIAHLKKGSAIIVVGELNKPEIYTDREGKPQISIEITAEFIRFSPFGKPSGQESSTNTPVSQNANYGGYTPTPAPAPVNSLAENAFGSTAGTFMGEMSEDEEEENIPF